MSFEALSDRLKNNLFNSIWDGKLAIYDNHLRSVEFMFSVSMIYHIRISLSGGLGNIFWRGIGEHIYHNCSNTE